MPKGDDLAILAPVPVQHLESAIDVLSKEGLVAFGSKKWELFREVDTLRKGSPVPVLIYPSHEDEAAKLTYIVSWVGRYVGHVDGKLGAHPEGMKYRPPTTAKYPLDNKGHWAVFWHVDRLARLPKAKHLRISEIQAHRNGKWRKNAPPRGPELVHVPHVLADQLWPAG